MYKADYHLHTVYSMDCEMQLDTLCETALARGLQEICITDHTEFGHPDPSSDVPPDAPSWLSAIAGARERHPSLTIRTGIEIGDNPLCRDRIKAWHFALPLDFHLLSMHLIDNDDPFFADFFIGKTQHGFYRRYVESRLESIMAWDQSEYDALAHLGYCAKFAPYPVEERPLRLAHAPDVFDALLRKLAQDGKALEVNTSGHKTMGECIPDREIISRFAEHGGEFVTIGSDAHVPEYVGSWWLDAATMAKECGIRYLATYERRKLIPKKL